MEEVKCKCGNTIFIQMHPQTIADAFFRVWKIGEVVPAFAKLTPIFMCLSCNRYLLPKSNFSGKNILDPEVQAYSKLLDATKSHNDAIDEREVKKPVKRPKGKANGK